MYKNWSKKSRKRLHFYLFRDTFEKNKLNLLQEKEVKRENMIALKERIRHLNQKLQGQQKLMQAAEKTAERHKEQIKLVEKQCNDIRTKRDNFEQQLTRESQELDLNLSDEQV